MQPLFHQQCWCWGWDIRRPDGNLLIERGFRRRRPPDPNEGSSAYHLRGRGYRMDLWGFGVHYSRTGAGGVFVGRYATVPLRSVLEDRPDDVWSPEQLPPMQSVAGDQLAEYVLVPAMLRWITAYERWIIRTAGRRHRVEAVKEWGDKAVVEAEQMPIAWLDLARTVERAAVIAGVDKGPAEDVAGSRAIVPGAA